MMLQPTLDRIAALLEAELREELEAQGHVATGNLLKSVEVTGQIFGDGGVINVYYEDYGNPVDTGVSAGNIPFSPGSGAKSSRYIQGLMQWVEVIKGFAVGSRENKAMAFAVAHTHKKGGMPSRGSFQFSSNGRRTGWAERTIENSRGKISELILQGAGDAIERSLDVVIDRIQKRLAA